MINQKSTEHNPYKESAYSVYHNGCIELLDMLCMSNEPQEKVRIAVNMLVNMRSEIRVKHEAINKQVSSRKKAQSSIATTRSKK